MASTKELVYQVWMKLDGGKISDDSAYSYRQIKNYVVSGIGAALKASYFEQRNLEDYKYGDDGMTTTYKTAVLTDEETGLKYLPLQNTTISIAGNRFTSINSINPVGKFAKIYSPIRLEERLIVSLQPCVPNVTYYYKDRDRAWFYGENMDETSVYVSDRYALPNNDDADLRIPQEFENQVILGVLQILSPNMALQDNSNNGKPINIQ